MNFANKFLNSENTSRALSAIVMLLVAVIMNGCNSASTQPTRTPKALFILVDGIPADVVESTPTPNLDEISGERGYTRAYVGGIRGQDSEAPTLSLVGYASLLTGTWADKHNVWDNEVEDPNFDYWDIFRIAKTHAPSLHTAIFSTWTENRTKLLGDGLKKAGGNKFDYYFDGFELDTDRFPHDELGNYIKEIDELVTNETVTYVSANGPDLSWVYLEYTDDIGHRYGDSPEMTAAVRLMDAQIGKIWVAVQDREQTNHEDWLILITTDHGRDAATGKNHGGQSERERTTWIATNSNKLNTHFEETPAIVDILPSLATHLHLEIPGNIRDQLDGQSFVD